MDLAVGAAGALVGALLHTKGKLVKIGSDAAKGGGMLDKLGAAAASMSPIPIPGLGAKDPDNEISFMFNPTAYKLQRSVTVTNKDRVKKVGGQSEYLGTGPLTLTIELFFDDFASAKGDVTPKINKLFDWQKPEEKTGAPPKVKLEWGTNAILTGFEGVLTDVTANYSVFNKSGTPIQATVNVTIKETVGELKIGKNPTSHAKDMRRVHVMVEGESLASIANAEFGEPGYWRALAEVNGIDDPLRVRAGANILIPSAADAARMS